MPQSQKVKRILFAALSLAAMVVLSVTLEYLFKGKFVPRVTTVIAAVVAFALLVLGGRGKKKVASTKALVLLPMYLFFLAFVNCTIRWFRCTFPLRDVDQVLMTIQMPLDGFVAPFVQDFCIHVLPLSILFTATLFLLVKKFYANFKFPRVALALVFLLITVLSVRSFVNDVSLEGTKQYVAFFLGNDNSYELGHSDFLEKHYAAPESVQITAGGSTKNLVLIFLESVENGFVEQMPKLRQMLDSNVSFFENGKLSGGTDIRGAQMTISAMVAKSAGLPLLYSNDFVQKSSTVQNKAFFANQKTLFDILKKFGYKNAFAQGSDGTFAGTKIFFEQHGVDTFYDTNNSGRKLDLADSLKKMMFHPGFSDKTLFEISRSILDTLSKNGKFSLTLATIDTHFPHGFYDESCAIKPQGNSDAEILKAVLECSDNEIISFINWVRQQPYGANTEFVLVGDHLFMGNTLVENMDYADRKFATVFVNSNIQGHFADRHFTSFDMFPTILESMNFNIEGSELGLGRSLLSGKKTLLEELSKDSLNAELKKLSKSAEYQSIL